MAENITITVNNWDKYNVRNRDYKQPWWMSINNRILEDGDVFKLSDGEFRAWMYVLSQCSLKKSKTVEIDFEHATRVCKVEKKQMLSMIAKFSTKSILSVSDQHLASTRPASGRHITEQTEQNNIVQPAGLNESDLEQVYEKYPRKEGRNKGIKILLAQKLPRSELPSLIQAAAKYAELQIGVEKKFVKLFSTWAPNWQDYKAPDVGTLLKIKPKEKPYEPIVDTPHPGGAEALKRVLAGLGGARSLTETIKTRGAS